MGVHLHSPRHRLSAPSECSAPEAARGGSCLPPPPRPSTRTLPPAHLQPQPLLRCGNQVAGLEQIDRLLSVELRVPRVQPCATLPGLGVDLGTRVPLEVSDDRAHYQHARTRRGYARRTRPLAPRTPGWSYLLARPATGTSPTPSTRGPSVPFTCSLGDRRFYEAHRARANNHRKGTSRGPHFTARCRDRF